MCNKILESPTGPRQMDRSTTQKQFAEPGYLLPCKRLLFIQVCEDGRKNLTSLIKKSK